MGVLDITTPEVLPPGTTRVGPLVAWERDREDGTVLVWHWCTKTQWRAAAEARGSRVVETEMQPQWLPSWPRAHDLISTEPLHLEPSVYWPGCCGLHGFVRNGAWVGV